MNQEHQNQNKDDFIVMSKKHFQERLQDAADATKKESLSLVSENTILKQKLFDMEQELIKLKTPKESFLEQQKEAIEKKKNVEILFLEEAIEKKKNVEILKYIYISKTCGDSGGYCKDGSHCMRTCFLDSYGLCKDHN
jgi:hypothetical protein